MCEIVRNLEDKEYFADCLTKQNWGQTSGGYLCGYEDEDREPTQKEHFLSYYSKKQDKITYAYLRCPQLILFIAEVMGVPHNILEAAAEKITEFDKKYQGEKNGNYLWGEKAFGEFKKILFFSDVCKAIKCSEDEDEAKEKVSKLFG